MQRLMNNGLNKTSNFVQKVGKIVNSGTPNSTPTNRPQSRVSNQNLTNVQGILNEDEALAIAIQQSLTDQQTASTSINQGTRNSPILLDDEDDDLKRALELSKREYERNKDKCSLN